MALIDGLSVMAEIVGYDVVGSNKPSRGLGSVYD